MAKAPEETLLERERFELKPRSGGGLLSYEVWGFRTKGKSVVTRYNLAYVNHEIFQGDNGRVLGFDNAHGYHHRHYMGEIESVEFVPLYLLTSPLHPSVPVVAQSPGR